MEFLSKRGSKMLMIATISDCLEDLLNEKISDKWKLKFNNNSNFENLIQMWLNVISTIISFSNKLEPALQVGLKNKEQVNMQISEVKSLVVSIKQTLAIQLKNVIDEIA